MLDLNGIASIAQGLLILLAALAYFVRLEHRLTEIEVKLNSVIKAIENLHGGIR